MANPSSWVPPWRSQPRTCSECGVRAAASTLNEHGWCVGCVARPPEPEPVVVPLGSNGAA